MSCPIQIWDEAIVMEQDHSRTCVLLSSSYQYQLIAQDELLLGYLCGEKALLDVP
jgi:hypothetical protein